MGQRVSINVREPKLNAFIISGRSKKSVRVVGNKELDFSGVSNDITGRSPQRESKWAEKVVNGDHEGERERCEKEESTSDGSPPPSAWSKVAEPPHQDGYLDSQSNSMYHSLNDLETRLGAAARNYLSSGGGLPNPSLNYKQANKRDRARLQQGGLRQEDVRPAPPSLASYPYPREEDAMLRSLVDEDINVALSESEHYSGIHLYNTVYSLMQDGPRKQKVASSATSQGPSHQGPMPWEVHGRRKTPQQSRLLSPAAPAGNPKSSTMAPVTRTLPLRLSFGAADGRSAGGRSGGGMEFNFVV